MMLLNCYTVTLLLSFLEYSIFVWPVACIHPAQAYYIHHFKDTYHNHPVSNWQDKKKELNKNDKDDHVPIVATEWSLIQGFVRKVFGKKIAHFLGIPYALPPIGALRFRKALPLRKKHQGIYHANSYRSACLQTRSDEKQHAGTSSSEHCLFINVYTPWDKQQCKSVNNCKQLNDHLRPVLVFIHGSGYVYGSSANPNMYGGYLSSIGDMLFVIFNYRLGALGHMYGAHRKMPGNVALDDQKLALKWVQKNIIHFGGDPTKVTVMGHSAGATYQTVHMFSEKSRNLFRSAMIMSGNACERTGIDSPEKALKRTRILLKRVGCEISSFLANQSLNRFDSPSVEPLNDEEIKCLQRVDGRRIVNSQFAIFPEEEYHKDNINSCSFASFLPVYGTDFLPELTDRMLMENDFRQNITMVMGKVPKEGNDADDQSFTTVKDGINYVRREFISTLSSPISGSVDTLIKYYFRNASDDNEMSIKQAVVKAMNDLCNHCPTLKFAKSFAKFNKVFFYYYTYIRESFRVDNSRPYGATHADDTRLLFGLPFKDYDQFGNEDRAVSVGMIRLWSKFVHEGVMPWKAIDNINNKSIPYQYNIDGNFENKVAAVDPDDALCQYLI